MSKHCSASYLLSLLFGLLLSSQLVYGQLNDYQLAQHYYNMGEFEKAVSYYEKLYKNDQSEALFNNYYNSLNNLNQQKELEKLLCKHTSSSNNPEHYMMLGQLYEQSNESSKADKIYKTIIDQLVANPSSIINTFNAFRKYNKTEQSYQTLLKGRSLLKTAYPLNFQFADYYGAIGDTKRMIQELLQLLDVNPGYKSTIQGYLARVCDFTATESETYNQLKNELVSRANSQSNDMTSTEMLTWFFIQSRKFNLALTQEIAFDKRMTLNGARVYDLAEIAAENNDFTTAKKAYQYIIGLGQNNRFYHISEMDLLSTQYLEITQTRNVSLSEIKATVQQYEAALDRLGRNNKTFKLIIQLAQIEAYYNQNAAKAQFILEEALTMERLTSIQSAELKMLLADIYVLQNEIWNASLLYMQIDKSFKNEVIGHEARFKNARIFYYDGEFNYAQSQLDVLKQGTSRLISNDAIELSILITDNFGLDSNFTAMYKFAQADLLIEQRQFDQAFHLFDSIIMEFPYHSLGDEILIKKAKAMELQGKWTEALTFYDELLKYYKDDILADDAVYRKGIIYMDQLNELEKAQECFKAILLEHKGSLHSTDARKRFRQLRGDTNKED